MIESFEHSGIRISLVHNQASREICYISWPEGLTDDLFKWIESASVQYSINIAILTGINWNDDLTPWPSEGVFKKGKPFGGKSQRYLNLLIDEIMPAVEEKLEVPEPVRSILGVSLSGLFALWAGLSCDKFEKIGSISGSLWYDNFSKWVETSNLSPTVNRIFMTLGDREKNSKNPRMAVVEKETNIIAEILKERGYDVDYSLFDGTHFSPILPRLEMSFKSLF